MNFKPLVSAVALATALFVHAAVSASEVALSVYARPGSYGAIDVRDLPTPRLVYEEPVIIHSRPPVVRDPVYVHVPPGHAKHWSKHCRKYNACDRPVYFVDDRWYNEVYLVHAAKNKHGKHKHAKHP
jgi:hypothetical protein